MGKLEGQVAIVTGAAVGIGRDIAKTFAREGAKVVVNYSASEREAGETVEAIRAAGGDAMPMKADVSDDASVKRMIAETLARYGRIDILVNNAGRLSYVPQTDLESMTPEIWDDVFDTNVKGNFLCCRAVAVPMRAQGKGCIINSASTAGIRYRASSLPYGASKAAQIHLAQMLAKTLAPQIRVNTIVPSLTKGTRIQERRPNLEAVLAEHAKSTPMQRVGDVEDVSEVATFLAAGGAYITGAVIVVDGGRQLVS